MDESRFRTRELHDGWTVVPIDGRVPPEVRAAGPVPAQVPGVVHLDLMAAGLLADPYLGTNEKLQEWVGSTSWQYATEFDWQDDGADRHDLHLFGLDTVAEVELNGATVLSSRNQHRSHLVPVTGVLRAGPNRLVVRFAAPVPAADRASLELGYRPHVNHHPFNAIRKSACSFGWDWGPDTATSGIWRPVHLESWSVARITELQVVATVEGAVGRVRVRVQAQQAGAGAVTAIATIAGTEQRLELVDGGAELLVEVPAVQRWWPRGRGEQTRYDLEVRLEDADGVLDRTTRRVGFRVVEIDVAPDEAGTPFRLLVNGEPIFVRGVNWIPDDAFPGRVPRAQYAQRLGQAADAGVNLVRVWGGGIFESEDFYDLADEAGLLVWQDFLLACAAYAEEEPLRSEIAAEAREAVVRLGSHPSLVVLNGNNENLWGHEDWGWKPRLEGRTWGAAYYEDVFPRLVAELAPHVAYTPGSPFSPGGQHHPNDPQHGTMHIWDLWNQKDHPHYRDHRPRFVSEFGWQGPPTWSTLTAALPDEPLTPESPGMLVHQKALEGNVKLTDGLVAHLPLPNTMPEWHWAMSLNQAVAIRTAVEWFRSLQPYCTGTVLWQLNDCWPVVSWAAVDGGGRKKPLWYAMKAAYAERLVTLQPHDGSGLRLALLNDTAERWTARVRIERCSYAGEVLASTASEVVVDARGEASLVLEPEVAVPGDAASEVVRVVVDSLRTFWFFAEPRDSALAPAAFGSTAAAVDGGVEVTVTARTLLRDVALLVDVVDPDAEVDAMLVTLLPGESATFRIATASALPARAFLAPEVLRTMNELVNPPA